MATSVDPFASIEAAEDFLALLAGDLDDVAAGLLGRARSALRKGERRRFEVLQLVGVRVRQLQQEVGTSRRLLRHLRQIRELLLGAVTG